MASREPSGASAVRGYMVEKGWLTSYWSGRRSSILSTPRPRLPLRCRTGNSPLQPSMDVKESDVTILDRKLGEHIARIHPREHPRQWPPLEHDGPRPYQGPDPPEHSVCVHVRPERGVMANYRGHDYELPLIVRKVNHEARVYPIQGQALVKSRLLQVAIANHHSAGDRKNILWRPDTLLWNAYMLSLENTETPRTDASAIGLHNRQEQAAGWVA